MRAPTPDRFHATREALRAVACYVIAPARKARTGRIGLRAHGEGFGTPPFDDGTRLLVRGDTLVWEPDRSSPLTTLRDAAAFAGVALSPDPGVGHDLPPFEPDAALAVDPASSLRLGAFYAFGQRVLDALPAALERASFTEAQLWPEHFDLAVTATLGGGARAVNIGFSPGDPHHPDPYLYVGPHDTSGLTGPYWNAPFGALVDHDHLAGTEDPVRSALDFVIEGVDLLAPRATG